MPEKSKWKYTKADYERVLEFKGQGYRISKISVLLGIPKRTIYQWVGGVSKPYDAWGESDKEKSRVFHKKLGELNRIYLTGKKQKPESIEKRKKSLTKGETPRPDTGRQRAQRMYFAPEGKERHHIDGDTLNNDPSNIMIVTRREHMEIDGRLDKLANHEYQSKKIKPPYLRKCRYCGIEANNKNDLEPFSKDSSKPYGSINLCKSCRNKRLRLKNSKK